MCLFDRDRHIFNCRLPRSRRTLSRCVNKKTTAAVNAYPAFYARSHGREFNIESVQARQVADFA